MTDIDCATCAALLTNPRAVHFPADDDGNPEVWQVQAGDYPDEPDVVIVVEHAVDEHGHDVRPGTAAFIVWALTAADEVERLTAEPE